MREAKEAIYSCENFKVKKEGNIPPALWHETSAELALERVKRTMERIDLHGIGQAESRSKSPKDIFIFIYWEGKGGIDEHGVVGRKTSVCTFPTNWLPLQ